MKEIWQLRQEAYNNMAEANLSCFDNAAIDPKERDLAKNSVIRNTSEISSDIIELIDKMQLEITALKTLVNVCETRLDYAEDEIKKFKYERRKLNIG
jgi:hypothetical protein